METLIINIDTASNAKQLANFLKSLPYIKSVSLKKLTDKKNKIEYPIKSDDWAKPAFRKATDDELIKMIEECESGEPIPENEAREKSIS
jgi:hypothetical protein